MGSRSRASQPTPNTAIHKSTLVVGAARPSAKARSSRYPDASQPKPTRANESIRHRRPTILLHVPVSSNASKSKKKGYRWYPFFPRLCRCRSCYSCAKVFTQAPKFVKPRVGSTPCSSKILQRHVWLLFPLFMQTTQVSCLRKNPPKLALLIQVWPGSEKPRNAPATPARLITRTKPIPTTKNFRFMTTPPFFDLQALAAASMATKPLRFAFPCACFPRCRSALRAHHLFPPFD